MIFDLESLDFIGPPKPSFDVLGLHRCGRLSAHTAVGEQEREPALNRASTQLNPPDGAPTLGKKDGLHFERFSDP